MLLVPFLFALAAQTPSELSLGGRMVPIGPTPVPPVLAQEVTDWSGWGPFTGTLSWQPLTAVISESALATPLAADAVEWRVKIAMFNTSDVVDREGNVVRSYRSFMADPQENAILQAIARLPGAVAASTGGRVRLVVDATLEPEPARDNLTGGALPFGPVWREDYFGPRINGGRYEAEDRVFRGPYPSAILVVPTQADPGVSNVNGTPVAVATVHQDGTLDASLYEAWLATAQARSTMLGYGGRIGSNVPWAALASGDPPSTEDVRRLASATPIRLEPPAAPYTFLPSQVGTGSKVEIVADADRGPVLRFSETGPQRAARLALPLPKDAPADANTLTFMVRTESKEPVAVWLFTKDGPTAFSLGRDRRVPGVPVANELDVPSDGTWHKVGVDLKGVGLANLTGVWIGPSPAALRATDTALALPSWDFDDFTLEKDAATPTLPLSPPNAASTDPEARLAALASADVAALATALSDTNADVRITAATLLNEKPDPSAATALLAAANTIDANVARLAVRAYGKLDQPDEREQLLRLLQFGVTGSAKSEAAFALADSKDPKMAGEIMILLANRSGEVRRAAADALGRLPGREPGIIRTAFLRQEDPGIKLSVTMASDGSEDTQASKLRWSAVNEPSDLVRLWSAIRLIPSTIPEARKDGYGVVRDESVFVRTKLVEWMGANPNETHRPALRLALTDKSPLVRAASVAALKKQVQGPTTEELKPVANDPDPRVQAALGT